jgi:hypothetical protein
MLFDCRRQRRNAAYSANGPSLSFSGRETLKLQAANCDGEWLEKQLWGLHGRKVD